jgi:ubiquinone/menaquinone biosynthesis C-methylase UbiE
MNFNDFGIVCPNCKGEIKAFDSTISCRSCNHKFPIILGIPDLRYPPVDLDKTDKIMLDHYEKKSYTDLFNFLVRKTRLPNKIIEDSQNYYQNQGERTTIMTEMFLDKLRINFGEPILFRALDLGCGSGAGVVALSRYFEQVIGIDSSLAQLLIAKKYLSDLKIGKFILICANAENLPVNNQTISYIQATNVIEHIVNVNKVLNEISRSLSGNGYFSADSRNRYDLFFPEPHTGIRFLGFLPRKLIPKYVNYRCKSDYEKTQLLSYKEIKGMMNDNFLGDFKIFFPSVKSYGKPAWLDRWIKCIEKLPIIRSLIIRVFTTHIIIGQKQLRLE